MPQLSGPSLLWLQFDMLASKLPRGALPNRCGRLNYFTVLAVSSSVDLLRDRRHAPSFSLRDDKPDGGLRYSNLIRRVPEHVKPSLPDVFCHIVGSKGTATDSDARPQWADPESLGFKAFDPK
ncbi:hypothetical protein EVAR_6203_1 [Eumeta japonica]|uniref:Uncharacterized protein n=1 Tax=Eumeta variegata TaxID=151549 RepID=A0A4C2A6L0_EUMVA|nr:hypothetical protein EVAR_6203_1 [Eumeta japonica]